MVVAPASSSATVVSPVAVDGSAHGEDDLDTLQEVVRGVAGAGQALAARALNLLRAR